MSHAPTPNPRTPSAAAPTAPASTAPVAWVVAEFADEKALLRAARRTRKAGYRAFDVHTPYPVHGMDEAMGLGRSNLGWIVVIAAILGVGGGFGLQYVTAVIDYPIITAGKPYNSWQAWIVIMFEAGVLMSAFAAVFGMFALNGLPAWYHPVFKHAPMLRCTDNGFFLAISAQDPAFDPARTPRFLADLGGQGVAALEP